MMMVGPMKKKIVTTVIIELIVLLLVFGGVGYLIFSNQNAKIKELEVKAETLERYVFVNDMVTGDVVTADDIELVEVKAVSMPVDSYSKADSNNIIGKVLNSNVSAKAVISERMFYEDKTPTLTERIQEYNMISLPSDLRQNDYVDIRLSFATGEDYSVITAKKVEKCTTDTIFVKLTEDEIISMNSAIIEAYMFDGAKLYANKYINPIDQLHEYTKINYIERYNETLDTMLKELETKTKEEAIAEARRENAEITDEEIARVEASVNVKKSDIEDADIANRMNVTETQLKEIKEAIDGNDTLYAKYENYTITRDVSIARTYPLRDNVLEVIRDNPNIVAEIKSTFNTDSLTDTIVAERLNLMDENDRTLLGDDAIAKIETEVKAELELKKEERRTYLESLINNK